LRYIVPKGITQITKKPEYNWFFNFTNYFIKQEDKESKKEKILQIVWRRATITYLWYMSNVKKQRTLLLLDEPETHFNPDWQVKIKQIFFANLEAGRSSYFLTKRHYNFTLTFYNIRLSSRQSHNLWKGKSNNATFNILVLL
jgi:hypothetical protein